MSATRGTAPNPAAVNFSRMDRRHFAAGTLGAVIRTISQPTSASAMHCRTVRSTSCVSLVVIDCRRSGFAPPIPTAPTFTSTVWRRTV